jgi:hypothetical protein
MKDECEMPINQKSIMIDVYRRIKSYEDLLKTAQNSEPNPNF